MPKIANTSLLVMRPHGHKGRSGVHVDVYPVHQDSDWHDLLLTVPREHRPVRQSVYEDGTIPNPVPLHWCHVCDCWALKKDHGDDHPRDRYPQIGDTWEVIHDKVWIPAHHNVSIDETIDWANDHRVETVKKRLRYTATGIKNDPGMDPFEFEGRQYGGHPPQTTILYTLEYVGHWPDKRYRTSHHQEPIEVWREITSTSNFVEPPTGRGI